MPGTHHGWDANLVQLVYLMRIWGLRISTNQRTQWNVWYSRNHVIVSGAHRIVPGGNIFCSLDSIRYRSDNFWYSFKSMWRVRWKTIRYNGSVLYLKPIIKPLLMQVEIRIKIPCSLLNISFHSFAMMMVMIQIDRTAFYCEKVEARLWMIDDIKGDLRSLLICCSIDRAPRDPVSTYSKPMRARF